MFLNRYRSSIALVSAVALAPAAFAQTVRYTSTSMLALDDVEITPDEHYAVVRQNRWDAFALVYDLTSFTPAVVVPANPNDGLLGECVDAVAVTNTRAVVLGNRVQILDLTNLGTPVLASQASGFRPRDVALTPDGTIAAVRGGRTQGTFVGGQYLFDLATGAQIGFAPGEPNPYPARTDFSFEVDDVVATDTHAVMVSFVDNGIALPTTRVTIWELHPTGGGGPQVAFQTVPCNGCGDQLGAPHDLALTPDGSHAVVRSELAVGLYDLSTSPPALVWQKRPAGGPGSFHDEALDSVEATNDRVVTISKITNPTLPGDAQIDVFDLAGNQYFDRLTGSPHDLAITPDGGRALIRTATGLAMYDIFALPGTPDLTPLTIAPAPSSALMYKAGLDSIAVTDRYAVTLSRSVSFADTEVYFWDIAAFQIVPIAMRTVANNRPIDLAIAPDESRVVITGNSGVAVFDLETGAPLLAHNAVAPNFFYQWCDGVAVSANRAVAIGQNNAQNGWIDLVDLTPFSSGYCIGAPNSVGPGARISAGGDAKISTGSFTLLVAGTPPLVRGRFTYGTGTAQVPFGNGFLCVGGSVQGQPLLATNVAGAAFQSLSYAQQPPGVFVAGATLHFQFLYRDPFAVGTTTNASDAMSIVFSP